MKCVNVTLELKCGLILTRLSDWNHAQKIQDFQENLSQQYALEDWVLKTYPAEIAMTRPELQEIGSYMGFTLLLSFDTFDKEYELTLRGTVSHTVDLGTDIHGNLARVNNKLEGIPAELQYYKEKLAETMNQMEQAKAQLDVPFEKEEELTQKSARLAELNVLLNMDKTENEMVDEEPDEEIKEPVRAAAGMER